MRHPSCQLALVKHHSQNCHISPACESLPIRTLKLTEVGANPIIFRASASALNLGAVVTGVLTQKLDVSGHFKRNLRQLSKNRINSSENSRTDLTMTRILQVDLCWIVTQKACKVECFDEFRFILLAMCWVKQNIAQKIAARPMFLSISVGLCQNQPCSANTTLSENKLNALSDNFSS